jgi:hypothetical protein
MAKRNVKAKNRVVKAKKTIKIKTTKIKRKPQLKEKKIMERGDFVKFTIKHEAVPAPVTVPTPVPVPIIVDSTPTPVKVPAVVEEKAKFEVVYGRVHSVQHEIVVKDGVEKLGKELFVNVYYIDKNLEFAKATILAGAVSKVV